MKKIKQKIKELNMKAGVAHVAGQQIGAELFIKKYEYYRQYSGFVFIVLIFVFLSFNLNTLAFIGFGFLHLHILFNQLWWKIKNIEAKNNV